MRERITNISRIAACALRVAGCGGAADYDAAGGASAEGGSTPAGQSTVGGGSTAGGGSTDVGGSADTAGSADAAGAGAASDTELSGEVGSHVWSLASAAIEVRRQTVQIDSHFVPTDVSDTCWSLRTEAMSDAQRAILESVLLVPLFPNCTADGYTYEELTVISSDGTRKLYRDTGCSYLALPGAK
jgi:hypothetical protein